MTIVNLGELEWSDYRWLQHGKPFCGICTGNTPEGFRFVAEFKEGMREGIERLYLPSGGLVEEATLSEDAYHGERKQFRDGRIWKVITYKDGQRVFERLVD